MQFTNQYSLHTCPCLLVYWLLLLLVLEKNLRNPLPCFSDDEDDDFPSPAFNDLDRAFPAKERGILFLWHVEFTGYSAGGLAFVSEEPAIVKWPSLWSACMGEIGSLFLYESGAVLPGNWLDFCLWFPVPDLSGSDAPDELWLFEGGNYSNIPLPSLF